MILPAVKKQTMDTAFCAVPAEITYGYDSSLGAKGAKALTDFIGRGTFTEVSPFVTFSVDLSLEEREEIYRVTVSPGAIHVVFRDARGAVNGAATVALLLRKEPLFCCDILDYPDYSYRSFLLDFARGVPATENIFAAIRSMALAKYNRLHLHLCDSNGPCYVSEALPEYRLDVNAGKPCSKALLREIVETCTDYAIEVIPELEVPAHGLAVTRAHPEFLCLAEGAHGWAICPGNDDVWAFYDKLVGELVELFPESEYLHIGGDELEFGDLEPEYHCYWDRCPRCAALRAREGLQDRQAEFYYVVERMHEIVTAHGKKMMMWNDQIDVSRDVPLSRDILIQFWRIAGKKRGPYEGCTMEKLLEHGFTVVNSFYPNTYVDLDSYMSSAKMKEWNAYRTPDGTAVTEQILGGEGCAWEFGNIAEYPFYGYTIAASIALLGDKLWDGGLREHTQEYREALSEFLFGTKNLTCVFDAVGDILPPRKATEYLAKGARMPTAALLNDCLSRLKDVGTAACRVTANAYIGLFEKLLEQSRA